MKVPRRGDTDRARHSRRRGFWLASPLLLLAACWLAGLRLNLTGSLPVGLYRVSGRAPVRGALVLACLPIHAAEFAKARGYVPRGGSCPRGVVPIGKQVFALPGDTVTVTSTGLLVNGALVPNSQPLTADRSRRLLPTLALGRYPVGAGELWVFSPYSRWSFDSRYFGAVGGTQVVASLRPLWTMGSDLNPRLAASRPDPRALGPARRPP